jgi:hypothetical protein
MFKWLLTLLSPVVIFLGSSVCVCGGGGVSYRRETWERACVCLRYYHAAV